MEDAVFSASIEFTQEEIDTMILINDYGITGITDDDRFEIVATMAKAAQEMYLTSHGSAGCEHVIGIGVYTEYLDDALKVNNVTPTDEKRIELLTDAAGYIDGMFIEHEVLEMRAADIAPDDED